MSRRALVDQLVCYRIWFPDGVRARRQRGKREGGKEHLSTTSVPPAVFIARRGDWDEVARRVQAQVRHFARIRVVDALIEHDGSGALWQSQRRMGRFRWEEVTDDE